MRGPRQPGELAGYGPPRGPSPATTPRSRPGPYRRRTALPTYVASTIAFVGRPPGTHPSNGLDPAQWKYGMSDGVGGPGRRPVPSDRQVVQAEAIAPSVYRPDKLAAVQDRIDDRDLRDTVRR
ncbi:hypothetical protein ACH4E7_08520 [Kitasatospora sp. NPDC018058]|uniref:hypothetical protein n=1 Tax=Kitasatospora sp. NPDC018058 TaxID=3364025 RepID=UPI0037C079DB